jgi:RimJ/RimL family protein N-acetyltransferase
VSLQDDWPLFRLQIETPRVQLRYPTDDDLDRINAVASTGIHDPCTMPFEIPWTDDPPEIRPRNTLQYLWGLRASWKPSDWVLPLVVREQDTVVGIQELRGKDFAITRQVSSGSWLGQAYQGRGIGKEMRAAVLHLAFDGLRASRATSGAFDDNPASLAVSRGLGYAENGQDIGVRRGQPARHIRLLLERATWEKTRRADITIRGLAACLPMFGL